MTDWLFRPAGQIVFFAVLEAAALAYLYATRKRHAVIAAAAVPLIAAAVIVIDLLHVTTEERIARVLDEVRRAILARDAPAVLRHIDPDYDYQGVTRPAIERWLLRHFRWARLESVRIGRQRLGAVRPDRVGVEVNARVAFSTDFGYAGRSESQWRLVFVPREGQWVLSEIDPLQIGGKQFDRLVDVP